MEQIEELIKQHNLQEDTEYIIIPFVAADGKRKRCFLLKRRFIRIAYMDGRYIDYTLAEAIEAMLNNPDMKLSEALRLAHGDEAERSRYVGREAAETIVDQPEPQLEDGNTATGRALPA